MLFYNGCCLLAMIEVVTLIDAQVTDRPEIFVLCDEPFRFHWISFQALNGLHSTNILCSVDDDSSKTYAAGLSLFRVRTGEDNEPNNITQTGTLSYQEI